MHRQTIYLLLIFTILFAASPAAAQTPNTTDGPVYIVQSGDTLWDIAIAFHVTVEDLMTANSLTDADILSAGQELVIPGYEGLSGVLAAETVPYGETFRSLSRRTQVSSAMLRRLNRLVSPAELYVGISVIIPQQADKPMLTVRTSLTPGETLLELAVKKDSDPWTLAQVNSLAGTWDALPGDVLYSPTGSSDQNASGLPSAFASAEVAPLPLKQGGTAQVRVKLSKNASVTGILVDKTLHFFPMDDGSLVALQGVHAMLEPGLYPLHLEATLSDGSTQQFEQMILVTSGYYPREPVLFVEPSTIDPAVTEPENDQILSIVTPATPERYWSGKFHLPVGEPYCIKSWYGNRRSYNKSDYIYFHAGVDYGVCSEQNPLDIYAPASGVVVFAGPLTVRGNATIIDHGWGVYSGLWHQAETHVKVGDQVEAGQLIGQIGQTGRVTGPHLHWELWVDGVQVNPLSWLEQTFPQ